jgi:hypothetical protein
MDSHEERPGHSHQSEAGTKPDRASGQGPSDAIAGPLLLRRWKMSRAIVRSRWVWPTLVGAVALVLVSCLPRSSRTNAEDAGASSTGAVPSPTVAGSSTDLASPPSPSDPGAASTTSSFTTTMETLRTALHRFDQSPPTIHGTFELLSQDEGVVVRDEVWVAWPALRVKQRWKGSSGPVVIATSDGKRFGYRDPGSGEAGISRGLGGAFMPYPMLQYFGLRQDACPAPDILRTESMMGRKVIHIGCDESNGWDQWIDLRTGLLLREAVRRQEFSHQPYWGGYVQLEFGPRLDEGLFDPHSV